MNEIRENGLRLFNNDCLSILPNIPDGSITMVVTDPPYGMDFQSNRSKEGPRHDKIKGDVEVDSQWISECYRVLKDGGCIISFCNWETSCEWAESIKRASFNIKSQVIWNRLHHGMGDLKGAFAPQHDIIWYGTKGRRIFKNGRPKSIIESRRPSPSEDNGHPTCKPVDLMESLIRSTESQEREIILDPFMGSGSTGVAAINLGHFFVGIELDSQYYGTSRKRIEDARNLKSDRHSPEFDSGSA